MSLNVRKAPGNRVYCAVVSLMTVILCVPTWCLAEHYPGKPIRLIVPYAPGGGNDTMGRGIGAKLAEAFGQQVIIDNRAGANCIVGSEIAATAAPDGYTLFVANASANSINPWLYKKLPYDPIKSFTPVSLLGTAPNVLVVNPATPAGNINELVALAKARPGKLSYGSTGIGSSQHLAGVMFGTSFGIDIVHVPYKGTAPAIIDLIGGQTSMSFANVITVVPHIKTNRLRALAVTGPHRLASLPNVPAIAEILPGFSATTWYGIVGPSRMPEDIVVTLNREIVRALGTASMKEQMEQQGVEPHPTTPAEFLTFMEGEYRRWGPVVKKSGATVD